MPPPEPVKAAFTRAPAPALSIISSSLNGPEEFPTPGPGWQFDGATRAANRVSNLNTELKANTLGEAKMTSPRERATIIMPSLLVKEDVTLAMIMHAIYDKNLGIKMVSPLLRLGLNLHMFVYTCVHSRLDLSRHYLYL